MSTQLVVVNTDDKSCIFQRPILLIYFFDFKLCGMHLCTELTPEANIHRTPVFFFVVVVVFVSFVVGDETQPQ